MQVAGITSGSRVWYGRVISVVVQTNGRTHFERENSGGTTNVTSLSFTKSTRFASLQIDVVVAIRQHTRAQSDLTAPRLASVRSMSMPSWHVQRVSLSNEHTTDPTQKIDAPRVANSS